MGGKPRARQGRAYWTGVLARFERREQSHVGFCDAEKLSLAQFRYWLYKLRQEPSATGAEFVEVVSERLAAATGCVVIVGSVMAEFRAPPTTSYLAELLVELDSRFR